MRTDVARPLIYLTTILSLGHHLDHAIRGNHVGWPLTSEVTPFTYSLAVYPLILLGLYLSSREKVGAGYWALISGPGAVFLAVIHLGPWAVEPPGDIIHEYASPAVGYFAFAWLLVLIVALVGMFIHEVHLWRRNKKRGSDGVCLTR